VPSVTANQAGKSASAGASSLTIAVNENGPKPGRFRELAAKITGEITGGELFCSRDVQAIGRQGRRARSSTPHSVASDNSTLLHWSYSNAATFLPWFISAGRSTSAAAWLGSAHLRLGACAEPASPTKSSVFVRSSATDEK
jgi:hypothetical protein